jgi:hypothetical protein
VAFAPVVSTEPFESSGATAMPSTTAITTKCRMTGPHRDYFCLCRALAPVRPYGATEDAKATMTADCGCIRLVANLLRLAVVDPRCERHRIEPR